MKKFIALLGLMLLPAMACAQVIPSYNYPSPGTPPMVQLQCTDTYTACLPITTLNPTPYAIVTSASATVGTAASATAAVASALVVKTSAGNLYGVNVTTGANAGYVLIFNAITAPADGAVTPRRCIPIAANTGIELSWRPVPLAFATGITVVFSTTGCFTKTADATAFISADAK